MRFSAMPCPRDFLICLSGRGMAMAGERSRMMPGVAVRAATGRRSAGTDAFSGDRRGRRRTPGIRQWIGNRNSSPPAGKPPPLFPPARPASPGCRARKSETWKIAIIHRIFDDYNRIVCVYFMAIEYSLSMDIRSSRPRIGRRAPALTPRRGGAGEKTRAFPAIF